MVQIVPIGLAMVEKEKHREHFVSGVSEALAAFFSKALFASSALSFFNKRKQVGVGLAALYVCLNHHEISVQQSNVVRNIFNLTNWENAWVKVLNSVTPNPY